MFTPDIHLVITAALKKELPPDWLESGGIPVHTIAELKSGAAKHIKQHGMIVVITGAGPRASRDAALWILDHIKPLFVLNIGTCGVTDRKRAICKWIIPEHVLSEGHSSIKLDDRIPIPFKKEVTMIKYLLTVSRPDVRVCRHNMAIDMECFEQASVFHNTETSFHCLKFSTDYADSNTLNDFNRNLKIFRDELRQAFSFLTCLPAEYVLPRASSTACNNGITVIIPVYNRLHTIRRAIDSVLAQSAPPHELIVVDDGSTDSTSRILDSYRGAISIITLPENAGPSRARNEGIRQSKTEWIAFLDSDDQWERHKLKRQISYLKKYPFYQIIQSEEKWIRNGVRVNPKKYHQKQAGWIWKQSLERCLISPSGVLLKKALIENYGLFDEQMPVCEDYDLWLKISRWHPVGLSPDHSVIKYGGHGDQLSLKYKAMDRFRVYSMLRLLQNESNTEFRRILEDTIAKKIRILMTGYEKRGKLQDMEECKKILEKLNQFNQQDQLNQVNQ